MKKLVLFFLAVPLLLPVSAFGQDHNAAKSSSPKSITISGRVSEDGKTLTAKNGESWSVTNPSALTSRENQQVKVKCEAAANHSVRVISLKILATPVTYHANPGDSAFRR